MRKENSREKKKEISWRVQLQGPIFLIQCGKNPVIYDDPTPPLQLSMSFFNSIPHFSTFRFSPWSKKKSFKSVPRTWAKNPSRGQESLLSTLDIQTGYLELLISKSSDSKAQIHLRV